MHALLESLLKDGPVLIDGGWGTQLQARGLPVGTQPDGWNLEQPEAVESVAADYVAAGSRIVLTNTFGASSVNLQRHALAEKAAEINRVGAELSRRAAGETARVFGSIGPSGKMIMMGEVTPQELEAAFFGQADALKAGGADGLVIETMSDPQEAEIAVAAAKKTGLPVVGCMVFDAGAEKDRTMMGTTPEQVIERLTDAGADVIGSNCGQGIDGFLTLCRRMRSATDLPLWMKPNAGLPEIVDGETVYRQSPEEFAEKAMELIDAGATMIGGCCGTSPDFIRAVAEKLYK